ncbi:MAG: RluA family pseudouridine synthase [Acutalibacteraceae bacterium]|nr:RluA family pseudouridine synthase [Acutalibacteraceae bacterium]
MREIIIGKNDANQRLDKFLTKRFKNMPKSLMYKYIRTKYIKVNNKRCEISTMLNEGDILKLFIKEEFFDDDNSQKENYDFLKAPTKLDIIYEDENILLINKKPGVIVHPDEKYHFDSLISRVLHYLYDKKEYNPKDDKAFAPALVNRIDRNTGGIVIAAKNAESLRALNAKMKTRELTKLYLCMVQGTLKHKQGLLDGYLEKNEKKNKVTILKKPTSNSKPVKTKYTVISNINGNSLVEVDLLTGRTHQIRAHMSSIGHPLLGDTKYGYKRRNDNDFYKYQALYAYKITFKFTSDAGCIEYLNGKSFEVNKNGIWFLGEM